MKSLNIKRTVYPKEVKELLESAHRMKITGEVSPDRQKVYVRNGLRTVGIINYSVEGENCIIGSQHIIEKEFHPLVVALETLVKFYKRKKKIKKILY